MTDQEHEKSIAKIGEKMESAYAKWEVTGCFSDRGEADGWRLQMEEAIASRSPEQVAILEAGRGLA